MMLVMQVLGSIILFTAVLSLAAVKAEEEMLESDEELDAINNDEDVAEDEETSFDNAVDIQEG